MEKVIRMIKYGFKQQLSRFEVIKYQVLSPDNQSGTVVGLSALLPSLLSPI